MRNVIVTGGSRGIGLGIATKLSGAGYRVISVARRSSAQLDAKINEHLWFWPFDLADLAGLPSLVKSIRDKFGPLYALVNNAGIGTHGVLATMRLQDIQNLVLLNTVSPIVMTKAVTRMMMIDGGGRIINISSIIADTGFSGLAVYGATKASLNGFTKSLAREVGPLNITVNAIAPGFVATSLTEDLRPSDRDRVVRRSPLRRLAEIDDVADAVEFLIGPSGRNITGTIITIDAGSTA